MYQMLAIIGLYIKPVFHVESSQMTNFSAARSFLEKHNLLPKFQSGYRGNQSMETAVLKIVSDVLSVAEKDMSAPFDSQPRYLTRTTSYVVCRLPFAERLYLGSAPLYAKRCKPSPLMVRCPKRRRSRVVFPRAASLVRFCSCSTRRTWRASLRCMESTSTHKRMTQNHIFTPRWAKLLWLLLVLLYALMP